MHFLVVVAAALAVVATPASKAPLPAGEKAKLSLAVTREGAHDAKTPTSAATPDGPGLTRSGQHVVRATDATGALDFELDFEPYRGAVVKRTTLGGDHAHTSRGTTITWTRRLGDVVFAVGSDFERGDMNFLIAVDGKTGKTHWKTIGGIAANGFAIVRGHALASSKASGTWEVLAIDLETGKIAARVPVKHGPYRFELSNDGKSALGFALANEVVMAGGDSWDLELALTAK